MLSAHSSTTSVPITVLLCEGPLLCCFNVSIKGLMLWLNVGAVSSNVLYGGRHSATQLLQAVFASSPKLQQHSGQRHRRKCRTTLRRQTAVLGAPATACAMRLIPVRRGCSAPRHQHAPFPRSANCSRSDIIVGPRPGCIDMPCTCVPLPVSRP